MLVDSTIDIVALGELLIDFTCLVTDDEGYPTMAAHPGGAPANFLAAAAKWGASTAMIGKVGTDAFGKLLTDTLRRVGIGTEGLVAAEDGFTTLAFVTLDERGEREFSFARKPGADTMLRFEEVNLSLLDRTQVFHFGTLSLTHEPARSATIRAVGYARERGKLITFDPNLRRPLWDDPEQAKEWMLWGLKQADVVKLSEEEAEFLFGLEPQGAARHIVEHFGGKLVFVTCGADGCWFANPQTVGFVPALSGLSVVDTTGAGDIFGGSAVWKLLQSGKTPEALTEDELREITLFACAAAGLSTEKAGGISSVPERADVADAVKRTDGAGNGH